MTICINHSYAKNVLQKSTKIVGNWYFADFEITMLMCSDDPPSYTEAISSSCAQVFCANEAECFMERMWLP